MAGFELSTEVEPTNVAAIFGRLPLGFEPNQGQSDSRVRFLTRGAGYSLFLTENKAVLALPANQRKHADPALIQMRLADAKQYANITALNPLLGHSNYFIGNDASRWKRNVPQFSRVRYRGIYSGIDLDFYGK